MSKYFALLLAGVLFAACTDRVRAEPATTNESVIRAAIQDLAEGDKHRQEAALHTIATSHDGRLVDFLQHVNQGSVDLDSNSQVVVCPKFETTDAGEEVASLRDPLTGQALVGNDGQAVVAPASELQVVRLSRQERKAVADAIHVLEI